MSNIVVKRLEKAARLFEEEGDHNSLPHQALLELKHAKAQLEENTKLMDAAKAEIEKLRKENEVLKREVGHLYWRLEKFEAEDAAAWEELSRKP